MLKAIRLIFHKPVMETRRVLLICSNHLFGEAVEAILRTEPEVELIGPWKLGEARCAEIAEIRPSVVLIADEDAQSEASVTLTAALMETYPELPVIRLGLTENVGRVIFTHMMPARGADLIKTIRSLPGAGYPPREEEDLQCQRRGDKRQETPWLWE